MPHKYDSIVAHFTSAFTQIREAGLADVLPKGGLGAILLAHHLNHELVPGDKGADAIDTTGHRYEYKVSITNQFNFHFGARREKERPSVTVERHFKDITGAYCAIRDGEHFLRIAYCPTSPLVAYLSNHFEITAGGQLNKNFRLESFLGLNGSRLIHPPQQQ